jgi:hypothetical protein
MTEQQIRNIRLAQEKMNAHKVESVMKSMELRKALFVLIKQCDHKLANGRSATKRPYANIQCEVCTVCHKHWYAETLHDGK